MLWSGKLLYLYIGRGIVGRGIDARANDDREKDVVPLIIYNPSQLMTQIVCLICNNPKNSQMFATEIHLGWESVSCKILYILGQI